MLVKCRHCGGENAVHPGQRMLFCSFCGSALAIERTESPEHLILPHKRNDRGAGEALRSYLLSRKRGKPEVLKTDFAFAPFLLIEDENGDTDLVPAPGSMETRIPYPPAGNYHFFDDSLADGEKVIPLDGSEDRQNDATQPEEAIDADSTEESVKAASADDDRASAGGTIIKILHLPIYTLEYKCGRFKGDATIVGGSWLVKLKDLPAEATAELRFSNLMFLAALFTAFLFIGKAAPGWLLRFVYVLLAAAAGFTVFYIREKVGSHS